jgi:hypothetical protein
MNKTLREKVKNKFNGRCAYSGTILEDDWQVDHLIPKKECNYFMGNADDINNLVPSQKLINHYKRALSLETFRSIWLGKLHKRLLKLPKNPRSEKSIKRKLYLLKIAEYFKITPEQPFSGVFYFESIL